MTATEAYRKTKRELVKLAMDDAAERGRRWVIGGPTVMSKDELIHYLASETEVVK